MKDQALEARLKLYVTEEKSIDNFSSNLLLTASAVASMGALLIPPPAEAAIVYSGVLNKEVNVEQTMQTVDFNGGGAEFIFSLYNFTTATFSQILNGPASIITSKDDPKRIGSNYTISNQKTFTEASNEDLAANNPSASGNFLNKKGFLGVKFQIASNTHDDTHYDTHYGWIQYKANIDASVGTIIDWAYEDTPDAAIKTGDTGKKVNWNLFLPAITAGSRD